MSRDLILVAAALFTWGIGEGMFFVFQPLYLQKLGANPIVIGTILSATGIAMAIAHIPAGYLADRIGRRPLLWASWFIGLVAAWLMALASSLPVFVTGMLVYALTSFVIAPLASYVTAARGKLSVGRALTLIGVAFNSGAIIGPLLGGRIGDQVGLQEIYIVSASVLILSTAIIFFIRSQPLEHATREERSNGLPLTRAYFGFLGIVFLVAFATYLPQPLTPNYLQTQHGLTFSQIGGLGSIGSLGIVVLNLILGRLEARKGFLIGQAAVGLFALIMWRATSMPWFILGYFLLGGYRTTRTLASAQTRNLVHRTKMGLAYGITETVGSAAVIAASPLAGFLYEANPSWMYIAGLSLVIVSLIVSVAFNPARQQVELTTAPIADS